MRTWSAVLLSPIAALLLPAAPAPADDAEQARADEQTLRTARVGTDGPALLEFFRKRTPSAAELEKLENLVRQLGDPRYKAREKASADLVVFGRFAVPFLQAATQDADLEVRRRAVRCLRRIEQGTDHELVVAAARVLARRKEPGAAAVLLNYYPHAGSEDLAAEVQTALAALARVGGKPDETLVKALEDRQALRRAAAAEALVRACPAEERAGCRKLLKDPEPAVRLRVALAFLDVKDKAAVPVLIGLVGELPQAHRWQAEEVLFRLAGDNAPKLAQDDKAAADRLRQAWDGWWRQHGQALDLARLEGSPRLRGYTLVVLNNSRGQGDQVVEFGADGKARWQITQLGTPRDAQVIPGERVLIAEETAGRVTERDFKGKILWEMPIASPIACQRLPNGQTFIGTRNQLLVVNRNREVVARSSGPPNFTFATAFRFPDGHGGVVLSDYTTFKHLDSRGKEVGSFKLDFYSVIGNITVLPNRHLLVPEYRKNRLVEYDGHGKEVWSLVVQQPTSVERLPNGHLLVSSWTRQWMGELDRSGKVLKEQKLDGLPCRVRRR